MDNLKTYALDIDNFDFETGLYTVSLVDYPAVERNFLKFEKENPLKLQFNDEEKHIITGVALLADTPIYRNNDVYGEHYVVFTKELIEKLVTKFAKFGMNNAVNLQHDSEKYVDGITMIESYFVDKERGIVPTEFKDVPNGSWIVSYKINNLELWDEIKNSGKLNGFSIEGYFTYGNEVKMSREDKNEQDFSTWLDEFYASMGI